nr:small RNA 2'-O-methyltransferase isoform X1 [Nothobranchius furzeri]
MNPLFSPALHQQRHQFVINFVKMKKPKMVADLGCNDCKLLKQLKFHREIELLVGVDINGDVIKKKMRGLAPLSANYLQPTCDQLCVELYQGSVMQRDARLRGFHLVTCIELIEHLTLTDLDHFTAVVFGYMTPLSVIISTPNSEYNALLPGLSGFRHRDHKFEWNRAEFRSWALKVCLKYSYKVEFTGVGEAPLGMQDSVGFCSQIGVFYRLEGCTGCNVLPCSDEEDVSPYTLLYSVKYPSLRDNNTLRRVLVSEVLYWAEQLKNRWMEEKSSDRNYNSTFSLTEERAEGFNPTHAAIEGWLAACAEGMDGPVGCCGTGDVDKCEEMLWRNGSKLESGTGSGYISIPLAVLWSCCPKVSELGGSLRNLRHLLMDEPHVNMSQDGAAVLVKYQEQDEEDDDAYLEDGEYSEASWCSHGVEPEEDWETV